MNVLYRFHRFFLFFVGSLLAFLTLDADAGLLPSKAQRIDTQISGVINIYTPLLAFQPGCLSYVRVENAAGFSAGDKILIIQMQGAVIDASNTAQYGTVISANYVGNYEFARVKSITGTTLYLQDTLLLMYSTTGAQVIRVPEYQNAIVTDTLKAAPWNGKTGGVVVLSASETLRLQSQINVSEHGYRGAIVRNAPNFPGTHVPDYVGSNIEPDRFAAKGEGMAGYGVEPNTNGKGAPANGGGGGNNHNAGGGGGANVGAGGSGGYGWNSSWSGDNKLSLGLGGHAVDTSGNHAVMGGGAGAGHTNQNAMGSGGNGGGIVMVIANDIVSENQSILSNGGIGGNAPEDGAGGGGAGGSVFLFVKNITGNLTVHCKGGSGGNIVNYQGEIGPGGGGGGGGMYMSLPTLPSGVTYDIAGGISGKMMVMGTTYGATNGGNGNAYYTVPLPESIGLSGLAVADAGIDHYICSSDSILIGVPAQLGQSYSWRPVTGLSNSSIAQPHAKPSSTTTYILTVSTASGCIAYDTVVVNIDTIAVTASPDVSICSGSFTQLRAIGGDVYSWYPSIGLDNPSSPNPMSSPNTTTRYRVIGSQGNCVDTAFVTVTVLPAVIIDSHVQIVHRCAGQNVTIGPVSREGYSYSWTPPDGLSSSTSSQTIVQSPEDRRYILKVVNTDGCIGYDTVEVRSDTRQTLEILSISTDSTIIFDSLFIGEFHCRDILLYNHTTHEPYYLTTASLMRNIHFSVPQSQLPTVIPPGDTLALKICFLPTDDNVQFDTLILPDICSDWRLGMRGVGSTSLEPWLTRCNVPMHAVKKTSDTSFSLSNAYPQPADLYVDIEVQGNSVMGNAVSNVALCDILGNPVANETVEIHPAMRGSHKVRYRMQTSLIPSGVYSLIIRNGADITAVPIVISHRE